jgi:hypothetical protein
MLIDVFAQLGLVKDDVELRERDRTATSERRT